MSPIFLENKYNLFAKNAVQGDTSVVPLDGTFALPAHPKCAFGPINRVDAIVAAASQRKLRPRGWTEIRYRIYARNRNSGLDGLGGCMR